jgi:exosome complex exonuclease DIS3/RRP44
MNVESNKALADSLNKCVFEGFPEIQGLMRILAVLCMTQAQYFLSGEMEEKAFYHYGLALPIYTHFTSPIRRYADVLVHRLLAKSCEVDELPRTMKDTEAMQDCLANINLRKYNADTVSRKSDELFANRYFLQNPLAAEDAIVISVHNNGIRVLLPNFSVSGSISLTPETDAEQPQYTFDEDTSTLTTPEGIYQLFDRIKVNVRVKTSPDGLRQWAHYEVSHKKRKTIQ